ncbi:MAG: hypothetical protein U0Y68_24810 [Blastocatellia bacterium]
MRNTIERLTANYMPALFMSEATASAKRSTYIKADNKTHARELYEKMRREYGDHGHQSLDASRMTFNELAKV